MTLYEILNVERTASAAEIQTAYRRRVKETHPDKACGDREKFQQVQHAYEVLGDVERKRRYDECGDEGGGAQGPTPTAVLAEAFAATVDLAMARDISPLFALDVVLRERLQIERANLREHEASAKAFRKVLKGLIRKHGEPILEGVLEGMIMPHERGAEHARGRIGALEGALALSSAYQFRPHPPEDELSDLLAGLRAEEAKPRRRQGRKEAA